MLTVCNDDDGSVRRDATYCLASRWVREKIMTMNHIARNLLIVDHGLNESRALTRSFNDTES